MIWKCFVCEKNMETPPHDHSLTPPEQEKPLELPIIEGGYFTIDFGYGSKFDTENDLNDHFKDRLIHAAICDDCFESKIHLIREAEVIKTCKWVEVKNRWSQK